ncbi:ABC transporter substrate-binding protein [Nitrincola sp. MINF-07-Sa-05]|uniref:ABC transporter substrate-binding protein n=1 Tax=Nitrincola salilacus TaxID=3400273 RepID=UPI003917FD21
MRSLLLLALIFTLEPSRASTFQTAGERWLTQEFTASTLSREEQQAELEWFIEAARPFRGMTIRVVSERIDTHWYESNVLAKAFTEITGIHVIHEVTGEDDLVRKIQVQMDTGLNIYDAYVNDTDFIGTHYRRGLTVPISDYIDHQWSDITLPTLDLDDFIGLAFGTAPDDKLYQLPTQQFANLYWYRHDWFSRPDLQADFLERYNYPLGVPQNWAAYEDIADFFTNHIQAIDGKRVWGHMDYASTDPSLGWRISDSWLSLAGAGDKGLPNGIPVDDWGIRVDGCHPVGASVSRGGAIDSPASIHAIEKYLQWLNDFAPPEARELTFTSSGEFVAGGNIAQQIFWYTAFLPAVTNPDSSVVDEDGMPLWRVAPSPRGPYWETGMKSGYQDAGGWTFLLSTPQDNLAAAWLYAQFTVSKSVSLQKLLTGLTPIRRSDIESDVMTENATRLGGLVEFYRSNGRNIWTPTGSNVPDYAYLSSAWWQHVSKAVMGIQSADQAMKSLALDMDQRLQEIGNLTDRQCKPILNEAIDPEVWLQRPGSPKPQLDSWPAAKTLPHEEAIEQWK